MKSYTEICLTALVFWLLWGGVAWFAFDAPGYALFIIGILAYIHAHQPCPEKP